jgi:2-polyprenyl-3-methyl-5-hydroxy-6-metoxy-1,4-benzoquinol methylase
VVDLVCYCVAKEYSKKFIDKIFDFFNRDGFAPISRFWFEFLYIARDPWKICHSVHDRRRIDLTIACADQLDHGVKNLLELGCGEGVMTEALFAHYQCPITAIDVSWQALRRAKRRVSSAKYFRTDALQFLQECETQSFDLIVACELVFYVEKIPLLIREMTRVSRRRLLSYHINAEERVLPHLIAIKDLKWTSLIIREYRGWKICTW